MGLAFWLAGVPGVLLLAFLSFVLSILPLGPVLIWLPAALWLLRDGHNSAAIFLAVWSITANSVVDSVVKPLLISRGGSDQTPLLLVVLGVFGGAAAFGFIGLFLGPTLLAIAYGLLDEWSAPDQTPTSIPRLETNPAPSLPLADPSPAELDVP